MKELYKFSQAGIFCLTLTLLLMSSSLFSQSKRTLTAHPNTVVDQFIHGFWVSLPASYGTGNKQYPLLLFMHGAGELGDGSERYLQPLLTTGPQKQINLQVNKGQNANFPDPVVVDGKSFEFIVVVPELNTWPSNGQQVLAINDMINYSIQNYRIDTNKMYLTGLSMGGGLSWEYAGASGSLYAKRLAAMLVVAGASIPNAQRGIEMASAHLPVWATHNAIDSSVSNTFTMGYVQALRDAGANPAPILTIFNQTGHGGWPQTYGDVGIPGCVNGEGLNAYQWMLQYRREGDNVVLESSGSAPPSNIFTVSAGPNMTIPLPILPIDSIQITGVATLQNEEIATCKWTQVMGPSLPSRAIFTGGDSIAPFVSHLTQGVYAFQVSMTSKSGKKVSSQMLLTVTPLPQGTFVAYAGPDVTITLPTDSWKISGQVIVKGVTPASCKWKQASGPSIATITGGGSTTPTVSNLIAGTYVFEMDLVSTTGLTSSSQMKLTVNSVTGPPPPGNNPPPTPPAGDSSTSLRLYPNPVPANQELAVEAQGWQKGTVKFTVYDGIGRLIRQVTRENTSDHFLQTIPLAGLSKGIYILTVTTEGVKSRTFEFFIR